MFKSYVTFSLVVLVSSTICAQAGTLSISEIWPGNDPGNNLTAQWFEITNNGASAWVSGVDPVLYYDDFMDAGAAEPILGITDIQPDERVIVLIGSSADVDQFNAVWSSVYDLSGIEIGYTNGSAIIHSVTLYLGGPSFDSIADWKDFPEDASAYGGQSWDVELIAWSTIGNANNADRTLALNDEGQSAIASPGNQGTTLGINDYNPYWFSLSIFPVPFNDYIQISTDVNKPMPITVKLFSLSGSEVYSETRSLFHGNTKVDNLSHLSSGIYLITIPELDLKARILKN